MKFLECNFQNMPNLNIGGVCIGKFDGFHIGHQHVIRKTKEISGTKPFAILTFSPLPFVFFGKGSKTIYTNQEKLLLAKKLNVDFFLQVNFNQDFANTSGEDFIKKIATFSKNIVVGKGFRFGKNQSCGENELISWQEKHNYTAHILDNIEANNTKISSGILRESIKNGDFEKYNATSNFPFFVLAKVCNGLKLASKIGFPTANCEISNEKLMPPFGVYASTISFDGKTHKSISNYGTKPTVQKGEKPILETHIFNYDGNLYGKKVKIEFLHKIRDEKQFESINQLQFQISQDIVLCKKFHDL